MFPYRFKTMGGMGGGERFLLPVFVKKDEFQSPSIVHIIHFSQDKETRRWD